MSEKRKVTRIAFSKMDEDVYGELEARAFAARRPRQRIGDAEVHIVEDALREYFKRHPRKAT